jgi:hypothetical protein
VRAGGGSGRGSGGSLDGGAIGNKVDKDDTLEVAGVAVELASRSKAAIGKVAVEKEVSILQPEGRVRLKE